MTKLSDARYIRITTFTKAGQPKPTPVWIADLGDGTVGFTTGRDSFKAKRIRNTPRVLLAPSDARGRVEAGVVDVEGTAEIVEGAAYERVRAAIQAKYGFQMTMIALAARIGALFGRSAADCAVVVRLG